jgi:hypothetical protein
MFEYCLKDLGDDCLKVVQVNVLDFSQNSWSYTKFGANSIENKIPLSSQNVIDKKISKSKNLMSNRLKSSLPFVLLNMF